MRPRPLITRIPLVKGFWRSLAASDFVFALHKEGNFMTSVQSTTVVAIGVGIDTSRYGHHVTFLRDDLQPATNPIAITEITATS